MTIKAIEPVADLDLSQVLYFTTQKLVVTEKPLDKETQQNLVLAKYSNGKAYVIDNFGTESLRAQNVKNTLQRLLSQVCPNKQESKWIGEACSHPTACRMETTDGVYCTCCALRIDPVN